MCMCMHQNAARSQETGVCGCVYTRVRARVCVCVCGVCTALRNTRYGPHVSIFLGSSCSDRSCPWPRQPLSPKPQVKTAPLAVVARLWLRPADTAMTRANQGLDLLRQRLVLLVAVAQLATSSPAPAPDGAVGSKGEAVVDSSRHGDDALPS